LPTNQPIQSALFSVYAISVYGGNIPNNLYFLRIAKEWNISEVTWMQRSAGETWDMHGGDVLPADTIVFDLNTNYPVWETYDITPLIQKFIDKPDSNFGFFLYQMDKLYTSVSNASYVLTRYYSSETVIDSLRPKLTITYDPVDLYEPSLKQAGNRDIIIANLRDGVLISSQKYAGFYGMLYNAGGRAVHFFNSHGSREYRISKRDLAGGVYLLEVFLSGKMCTDKIVHVGQ
jgi:hypothetical protein